MNTLSGSVIIVGVITISNSTIVEISMMIIYVKSHGTGERGGLQVVWSLCCLPIGERERSGDGEGSEGHSGRNKAGFLLKPYRGLFILRPHPYLLDKDSAYD
jgi:hypothetical protein